MEMFDREQIESVISEGYLDEEGEALLNRLPEFMNQTAGLVKECNGIMKQAFLEDGDRTDGLEETGEFDIQMD